MGASLYPWKTFKLGSHSATTRKVLQDSKFRTKPSWIPRSRTRSTPNIFPGELRNYKIPIGYTRLEQETNSHRRTFHEKLSSSTSRFLDAPIVTLVLQFCQQCRRGSSSKSSMNFSCICGEEICHITIQWLPQLPVQQCSIPTTRHDCIIDDACASPYRHHNRALPSMSCIRPSYY